VHHWHQTSIIIEEVEEMPNDKTYWFPAKRYGWGWGLPTVWQGWDVMAAFAILVLAGIAFLRPSYGEAVFLVYSAFLCAVLIAICWAKGEPPSWHWGDK